MKRTSDHQLTKDNAEEADAAGDEPQQGFSRAPPEVMAKRRIVKARRTLSALSARPSNTTSLPNPFAKLAKQPETAPPKSAQPPAAVPQTESVTEKAEEPAEKPGEKVEQDADKPDEGAAENVVEEKVEKSAEAPKENTTASVEEVPAQSVETSSEAAEKAELDAKPEEATEQPTEKPVGTGEKPAEESAEVTKKPVELEEKSAEPANEGSTDKPADAPETKSSEATENAPAESSALASNATNGTGHAEVDTASPLAPTETPNNHKNDGPPPKSQQAAPLTAPFTTPAPLKASTNAAMAAPKPAVVFGTTSQPITFASAAQSEGFNFKTAQAAPKVEEKKPEFKQATVKTGEEDDEELFRTRVKLYYLETTESGPRWKERGVGSLKLNKNKETGKARLLMRTEATLRVVLNSPVFPGFKIDRAAEKSIRFQGFDVDDEKKTTSYLARFSTKDLATEMTEAVEKCKKDLN